MTNLIRKKICLVGDFAVGKTSLVRQYVDREFSDKYLSTVGVKISRKMVELPGGKDAAPVPLELIVWDVEGSNAFNFVISSYLKGAHGTIVVADSTRPETITNMRSHIDSFFVASPQGLAVIALNKCDLVDERRRRSLLEGIPRDRVLAVRQTSAKTGEGVDPLFTLLAESLWKQEQQ
jgi:small GTP-binding protein